MESTIAYLVSKNYDQILHRAKVFQDEHAILVPHFAAMGFKCERVDWQDPKVDWKRFACILPKAVWNYFDQASEFRRFLEQIQDAQIPMQNSVESVRWNMDKRYLLDAIQRGLPVLPLTLYTRGSFPDPTWFSPFGSTEILVKPSVSGGSKNTIRFRADAWRNEQTTLATILREGDLIVQPFAKEVQTEGEYSFFFFGETFSHSILKKPRSGDFRAHSFFGAELLRYEASPDEIAQASKFVSCAPTPCAYARVDLIRVKGVLCLVELEIIEPYLYFELAGTTDPARSFAAAVVKSIQE